MLKKNKHPVSLVYVMLMLIRILAAKSISALHKRALTELPDLNVTLTPEEHDGSDNAEDFHSPKNNDENFISTRKVKSSSYIIY